MRDLPRRQRPLVRKPFPDALAPGYIVRPGPGSLGFERREMFVPFGTADADRFTRLHEMGHLKYTPPTPPGAMAMREKVAVDALQCCEDGRVNTLLEHADGLPMSALGGSEDLAPFGAILTKLLASGKRMEAVMEAARTRVALASRAFDAVTALLQDLDLGDAVRLSDHALEALFADGRTRIPFAHTIAAARILTDYPERQRVAETFPGGVPDGFADPSCGVGSDMVPWGTMEVQTMPMSARHLPKVSRRYRAADNGQRLRNVSRVLTDGYIFQRKMRQSGGALLLDGSGSMDMSPTDVAEILRIAPTAWVAIYGARSRHGYVHILAKDGKVTTPDNMNSPGSCNVIDGPALQLLAKQSAPRLWVCDGYVTGVGDQGGIGNYAEVARICTAANIHRFETVADAIVRMRSLAKGR